jgi:predicted enzyme related to lactoylglutathione lyase
VTAFYVEGLGLTVVPEKSSEGYVVFNAEGVLFAVHAIPSAIARNIEITDPPQARSDAPMKLVFQIADIEGACIRLAKLGGKLLPPRGSGSRDAVDPEGNVFQVKGP